MKSARVLLIISASMLIKSVSSQLYFQCTEEVTRHPHYDKCNKFYMCQNRKVYIDTCPQGLRFDAPSLECLPATRAVCAQRPTTQAPTPGFVCPSQNGRFLHESQCQQYYECRDWKAQPVACPQGLLFDQHSKNCVDERQVDCGLRQWPDGEVPKLGFRCRTTGGEFVWHPNYDNCKKYYLCQNNKVYIDNCPSGTKFDAPSRQCVESNAACAQRPTTPGPEPTTALFTTPVTPMFACKTKDGTFVHRTRCDRYYMCHNFLPYERSCPSGTLYDEGSRKCVAEHEADCGPNAIPDEVATRLDLNCGPGGSSAYPSSHLCSRYYQCRNGKAYVATCSEGLLFDEVSKQCAPSHKAVCALLTTTETYEQWTTRSPFTCSARQGNFFHESLCERYYECFNFLPYPRTCPPGTLFDQNAKLCLPEIKTNCGIRIRPDGASTQEPETTTPAPFACRERNGVFYHEELCERYYECFNWLPYNKRCPQGQLLDQRSKSCLPETRADCGNRRRPDGASSQEPETTTVAPFTCRQQNGVFYHEELCERYYECYNWLPYNRRCPHGQLLDQRSKSCLPETRADCGDRKRPDGASPQIPDTTEALTTTTPQTTTTTTPEPTTTTPAPTTTTPAPTTTTPEPTTLTTTPSPTPMNTTRTTPPSTTTPKPAVTDDDGTVIDFECTVMDGNFPHPTNRHKYVVCTHGLGYVMSCPADLVYDPTLKVCVWA